MSTRDPQADLDRWEGRYTDGEIPWDTGEPDVHLARWLSSGAIGPCSALEIGCGTGTNSLYLESQGFQVVGLDLSPTAIAAAQAKAAAADFEATLRVGDILIDAVPEAPFGLVYDRGVFHIFDAPERAAFAARVADLLVPGGLWHSLLGSTDGPPRDEGPPRRTAAEIMAAVEPHFEILGLTATFFDDGEHSEARAWTLIARRRETTPG